MEKNETEVWTDEQGAVFSADKKTLLHCPDVEEYVIPDHAEHVSPYAFDSAPRLKRINFNCVRDLPERVGRGTVEVPDLDGGGWSGDSCTGTDFEYHSLFEKCPLIEQVEFGENMRDIAPYALAGLKKLKSITTRAWVCFETLEDLDSLKELSASMRTSDSWHPHYSFYTINYKGVCRGGDNRFGSRLAQGVHMDAFLPSLEDCRVLDARYASGIGKIVRWLVLCKNINLIFLPKEYREHVNVFLRRYHIPELPQKNRSGEAIHYFWE